MHSAKRLSISTLRCFARHSRFVRCRTRHAGSRNHATISNEELKAFQDDGVVCLRGKFSNEWLEKVQRGIRAICANPSPYSEQLTHPDYPDAAYFNDYNNWHKVDEISDFILHSPAAKIAEQLMGSEKVAFYHEHVFTKDPGTCFATPWHHDQAYYPIDGWKNCSFWMPVSAVSKDNCLGYVKGSHRWGKWFIPQKFETRSNYQLLDKDVSRYSEMVDIDSNPDQYEVLSWDLEPGDCIAFHMRTVHGAPTESPDENGRQVLATRWLGDDAVLATRPWVPSPPGKPKGFRPGQSVFHYPGFIQVVNA